MASLTTSDVAFVAATASIVAAITAAVMTGVIALYRDRRLELRNLLIATRVLSALFLDAAASLSVLGDAEAEAWWSVLDALPGQEQFMRAWDEHRAVLAGHLTRNQWNVVDDAVRKYRLLTHLDRRRPPCHYSSLSLDGQHRLEAAAATLRNYTHSAGFLWNRGETNGAVGHEKVGTVLPLIGHNAP